MFLVMSISYMGSLRVHVIVAKVDVGLFSKCFVHCFQKMKEDYVI
jgi:hypothetical protein